MHICLIILIFLIFTSSTYDDAHYTCAPDFMIFSQEDTEQSTCLHHSVHKVQQYHFSSDTLTIPETTGMCKTATRFALNDTPFAFFPLPYDLSHPFRAPPSVS